jgi:threo-3-hydroxy-L-aspartate ammonia-lyase
MTTTRATGIEITAAQERIAPYVTVTPLVSPPSLSDLSGRAAVLKLDNRQRSGSFKFRGALNCVAQLPADGRGVIAPSSGNHGCSVAMAARLFGRRAVVLLPTDVADFKRVAVLREGATLIGYDRRRDDREALAIDFARSNDLHFVPSSDDMRIIYGAATLAREVLCEAPDVDALVVPVGGGGLLAGTCLARRMHSEPCEVFGVEPFTADDARRSLASGRRVHIAPPETVADGLRHRTPSALAFDLFKDRVAGILTVSDPEILEAVRFASATLGERVEPSGAVALAALLAGRLPEHIRRPAIVLSGGNRDGPA